MALHPLFKLREQETPEIVELLNSAVLGTNGAQYRHIDVPKRIKESDNPLFLSMERNDKVIGNITFCRRNNDWYVRDFAFSTLVQSAGKKKSMGNKSNLLRSELAGFFNDAFDGLYGEKVNSFYAYVDPNNIKSLWMSENFGFKTIAKIATQTFSRVNPKEHKRVIKTEDWELVKNYVESSFGEHTYFFTEQTVKGPFYIILDENQEIIAFTKISTANWEIKRLPGKLGGVLVNILPFIPRLNKLIRPKNHKFIVTEAVLVKNNDSQLINELFEGILHKEKKTSIFWWVDVNDDTYKGVKSTAKWGLLDKLIGVNDAYVVNKENTSNSVTIDPEQPLYTSGFDFI